MSQLTVDQALQIALQHHQAGQLAEAEDIYRQVLAVFPDQADAHHLLAACYLDAKKPDLAEKHLDLAIAARPEPAFFLTKASLLQSTHRIDDAIAALEALIATQPDFLEGHLNLGVLLAQRGRFEESAAAFQKASQLNPAHPDAQGNLGVVLTHLKRYDEAIWNLRQALTIAPKNAEFHSALASALYFKRQPDAALAAAKQAIALNPDNGQALHILSLVHRDTGNTSEYNVAAKRAAELLPDLPEAQINYGESLRDQGKLDEAAAHYKLALLRQPFSEDLHNNIANILKDQGLLDEAINEYRNALAIRPQHGHFSNLVYTLNYHPGYTPEAIFDELKEFRRVYEEPLLATQRPHANVKDPAKRLRIGYISGEFRHHALGLNLVPLFANHDKSQFEVVCYSSVVRPDFYTFRIRQTADAWHDVHGMTDEQLSDQIRRDGIDILVDLHQHIANNRLPLFPRKPAPVQIAFAGYPGTTGLTSIDYRLTDPYLEPTEGHQQPSSEIPLRLPHSFWCYQPVVDVRVNDLPALGNKFITFGNLNNFCKITQPTLDLWAKILSQLPNSQLLLLAPEGSHRARLHAFFQSHGIAPERIRFVTRRPAAEYYRLYHEIDLGLDSFPCNGHTTSLDSFYMGIPVITKIGTTLFGRATYSQLSNLNLPHLAAKTDDDFIALALHTASNLPALSALRQSLRDRMKSSPLMNEKAWCQGIESAYRTAWTNYCNS